MVDDHRIVLEGICSLLSQYPEIDIIAREESAEDALKVISSKSPQVVITDLNMPDYHGNQLIRYIDKKYPEIKIIVLSMHTEYFAIHNALASGAKAYLQKTCSADNLLEAIKTVLAGGTYFTKEIKRVIETKNYDAIDYSQLSDRETEVLKLIVDGFNSVEIGKQLYISSRTVDNHRAHMMGKLGVKNTAELVKTALLNQMV